MAGGLAMLLVGCGLVGTVSVEAPCWVNCSASCAREQQQARNTSNGLLQMPGAVLLGQPPCCMQPLYRNTRSTPPPRLQVAQYQPDLLCLQEVDRWRDLQQALDEQG